MTTSTAAVAPSPSRTRVRKGAGDPPPAAPRSTAAGWRHRNEVLLVGDLVGPVEPRLRADGLEVLTFRLSVRLDPVGHHDATSRRDGGPPARRDTLDCVVSTVVLRRRLEAYQLGDLLELDGTLRHRFWNAGGRVQSRYEVEVHRLKRGTRERSSRSAQVPEPAD